jgi:hypothetical protein
MEFPWLLAQLAVTAALAGLCWTVQLAVYPLFASVLAVAGAAGFREYHAAYTRGMGFVAAPLMLAEFGLAVAWLFSAPASSLAWLGGSLVAAIWVLTFAYLVPLHHRLQRAPSADDARRLTVGNWPRTVAWTARAGLLGCALALGV